MRIRSLAFAGAALAVAGLASTPAHAQVKAGGEFRAHTTTSGVQVNPAIAMQGNGDFIVTWMSDNDGDGYGIFGQRYARDGATKGGEFLINTTTAGQQTYGHLAIGRSGQFVVVWRGPDGTYDGIFGQRFDAGGAKVGGEFAVNTDTAGVQDYPGVAIDGRGNFVVAWTSDYGDGPYDYGVRAQRFDAGANKLGAEFSVNTTTYGIQDAPKLAAAADGRFVVVWESYAQDGSYYGVFGRRFDANGVPVGGEFQVNSYTTDSQGVPEVGMTPDGRFVVGWRSDEGGSLEVRAQRYDASGNAVGANFAVNSSPAGNHFPYSIAVDNRGNYIMAWDEFARDGDDFGSFGGRISSSDTRRGAEFQANSYSTGYQGISQVAGDDVGNFVVAWYSYQDPPDANPGIYAQRYGGLFPNVLVVDGAGNLVWEPGETVVVAPAWRNLNGASQTFGGSLLSLTGPAGATYTITDATAVYGTVASGASAPCTDCYGVSVNNPTTRPVQHWDATGVESITPDTQGQQKGWLLHIGGSFADVPAGNGFYRFVETLLHKGVTGGCGGSNYCPGTATTRDQMAVFVLVAKEGAGYTPPACTTPVFNDVPASSGFCRFIEELFRRGVVNGCGGGNYCPSDPVTREQMSIFTLRTLDPTLNPPACGTPMFNDVPASSPFCRWIEELARRGVVTGCGGGNYCPTQSVTRDQMGVFISVTFGLTLYGV